MGAEAESGSKLAHANKTFNMSGAGLYFHADPGLAPLTRETRGRPHARFQLILARVETSLLAPIMKPGCPSQSSDLHAGLRVDSDIINNISCGIVS